MVWIRSEGFDEQFKKDCECVTTFMVKYPRPKQNKILQFSGAVDGFAMFKNTTNCTKGYQMQIDQLLSI